MAWQIAGPLFYWRFLRVSVTPAATYNQGMSLHNDELEHEQHSDNNRAARIASILFGIAIHIVTGALLFAVPPGSVGALLLYIGLGIVGVLHILAGAINWKHQPEEAVFADDLEYSDIPWLAKRCPRCDNDIADVLMRGRRRCPVCSAHFSTRDLGWRRDDPAGEPMTLSPYEQRLSGPRMMAVIAVVAVSFVAIAVVLGLITP